MPLSSMRRSLSCRRRAATKVRANISSADDAGEVARCGGCGARACDPSGGSVYELGVQHHRDEQRREVAEGEQVRAQGALAVGAALQAQGEHDERRAQAGGEDRVDARRRSRRRTAAGSGRSAAACRGRSGGASRPRRGRRASSARRRARTRPSSAGDSAQKCGGVQ